SQRQVQTNHLFCHLKILTKFRIIYFHCYGSCRPSSIAHIDFPFFFSPGLNQFIGRMQDFRFYPKTLTNREIEEVYTGQFPHYTPSRHAAALGTAFPTQPMIPSITINDNDIGTTWISSVFPTLELLDKGITITIDLENGQYQHTFLIDGRCCDLG
uniref:Uncharacterized protein n=1 Tax=Sinocyclocheilus grahami TaxID=75366 RepID=A0A672R490_SINGR